MYIYEPFGLSLSHKDRFETFVRSCSALCVKQQPLQGLASLLQMNYSRAETNIRNVTNEPFSKRTNIRIFVRFDD